MEEMDFQIIEAEDGEKALEACRRGLLDVILLDWKMPIMDGYELSGNLRRMPGGDAPRWCSAPPKTPLTISSAHSMPAPTNT